MYRHSLIYAVNVGTQIKTPRKQKLHKSRLLITKGEEKKIELWTAVNQKPQKSKTRKSRNACIMILCCVAVCHLLRSGVAALFGPQSGTTSSHVQSICDAMEIPHIETRWDYRLRRDEYSVNLYPHPSALSKVSPSLQIDSFFCFLNSKR